MKDMQMILIECIEQGMVGIAPPAVLIYLQETAFACLNPVAWTLGTYLMLPLFKSRNFTTTWNGGTRELITVSNCEEKA